MDYNAKFSVNMDFDSFLPCNSDPINQILSSIVLIPGQYLRDGCTEKVQLTSD